MDWLINVFNVVLYQPLFNALILLYQYLPGRDFGMAVIVLTVIIRIMLYPLMVESVKAQKSLSEIQPKIKEIQEKYKEDKEKQVREMMALYQREKINPFGGCLPLLLQLPILIGLFQVFRTGFDQEQMLYHLYDFVPSPGQVNTFFWGIVDLSVPNTFLALLAGITQFFQTKMLMPKKKKENKKKEKTVSFAETMQKQMLYFLPVFTVFILLGLPSAIGLYWTITSLFAIGQQRLVLGTAQKTKSFGSDTEKPEQELVNP